eukprot:TRINITY_DN14960_c0_g3_i1.p2 TRINITY_DN14960_c0_g3~~TRINITY_DN14960_c0_g3_i1.p2  ORF type:complete len:100 (-),score=1.53 TRINITY_DN14960_c0_g3_i1:942-1241(-)
MLVDTINPTQSYLHSMIGYCNGPCSMVLVVSQGNYLGKTSPKNNLKTIKPGLETSPKQTRPWPGSCIWVLYGYYLSSIPSYAEFFGTSRLFLSKEWPGL